MKRKSFVLVPDGITTGLYCQGSWMAINTDGKIGVTSDYPMSPEVRKRLMKHTRAALRKAQQTVTELAIGLERLRTAPTKDW